MPFLSAVAMFFLTAWRKPFANSVEVSVEREHVGHAGKTRLDTETREVTSDLELRDVCLGAVPIQVAHKIYLAPRLLRGAECTCL